MTMTLMKMPSGALVHINNSRACVYGFDQRLEAFGESGMVQTANHRESNLIRWSQSSTEARMPLKHFFLERYDASFYHALDAFHKAITSGEPPSPTAEDGRAALAIALACDQSRIDGRAIRLTY
jgi:myo-inositol 2-dehydrogenase/D-chiro-inositol 1-dehydrogenase